mmetsp:Transcript_20086/g.59340  ORF Transcript_20086/g.59340 Transcript_20086/m.59340 type:complete len:265 (+) Transcript_20086:807-1601(+)
MEHKGEGKGNHPGEPGYGCIWNTPRVRILLPIILLSGSATDRARLCVDGRCSGRHGGLGLGGVAALLPPVCFSAVPPSFDFCIQSSPFGGRARRRQVNESGPREPRGDPCMHRVIKVHKQDVDAIEEEEHERLIPLDHLICDEPHETRDGHAVEDAIAKHRVPFELCALCYDRARGDDEQDVKYSRADDCAESNIGSRNEEPHERCRELGHRPASGHEGCSRDIWAQFQRLAERVEARLKIFVAHYGQCGEHVEQDDNVYHDGT